MRQRSGLEVVEAHDGEVASRLQSCVPNRLQCGERHQIRRGHDGRRPLCERQKRARLAVAGRRREVAAAEELLGALESQRCDLAAERVQPL
jgi:hypothetical protein